MKKIFMSVLCLTTGMYSAHAQSHDDAHWAAKEEGKSMNYENLDTTVKLGEDFARFATGRWIDYNPQPAGYPMWGTTAKVADDNIRMQAEMIQEIAARENPKGSVAQKIADIYNGVMDTVRLDAEGGYPVMKYLEEIRAISSRKQLLHYLATEHRGLLFGIGLGADSKDSKSNIVGIGQGGLSLGDREYYLSEDEKNVAIREAFRQHGINLFYLCGVPREIGEKRMEKILNMETELAQACYTKEQLRDPEANYHKMGLDELIRVTGGFDWRTFLRDYSYDQTTEVDLSEPEPVAAGCRILMNAPLEDLKDLCELRLIMGASSCLSSAFDDENLDFNSKLTGVKDKHPRWKIAVGTVSGLMEDAIGQMFVEKYFSAEAKEVMLEMIANLQSSLGERIQAQEWMSEETKQKALDKLNGFTVKVGYPDKWEDISGLEIDPEKSLYENIRTARQFYWNLNKEKKYNKPVDPTEWHMSAQTVNAYYNPSTNEICFPAGFLQPPLFDLKADAAANYGAVGVVIGHEMTHGFDDQGRQFDKEGNLRQWWSDDDVEKFKKPTEELAQYYDSLWVIPGELHANGHLTVGENIADHGGLNIAYNAFQKWQQKHGRLADETVEKLGQTFTPEQRFFLSYANVWTTVMTDELRRYLTQMDVHSLGNLRVNGALPQCHYWYDAFHIQPGDKLYIAPEKRVNIW